MERIGFTASKESFENVDGWTPVYTISSPISLRLRWANKLNSKSKKNRTLTNIYNYNKPQQKHRLGTVSNKLLGGLNRVYVAITSPYVLLWFIYTYEGPLLISESKQQKYKSRFITEMKQNEYSTETHSETLESQTSNSWTPMGPTKDRSSRPSQFNWCRSHH